MRKKCLNHLSAYYKHYVVKKFYETIVKNKIDLPLKKYECVLKYSSVY